MTPANTHQAAWMRPTGSNHQGLSRVSFSITAKSVAVTRSNRYGMASRNASGQGGVGCNREDLSDE